MIHNIHTHTHIHTQLVRAMILPDIPALCVTTPLPLVIPSSSTNIELCFQPSHAAGGGKIDVLLLLTFEHSRTKSLHSWTSSFHNVGRRVTAWLFDSSRTVPLDPFAEAFIHRDLRNALVGIPQHTFRLGVQHHPKQGAMPALQALASRDTVLEHIRGARTEDGLRFARLLELEETQLRDELDSLSMYNQQVRFTYYEDSNSLVVKLDVPGVREQRPSLLIGDVVLLRSTTPTGYEVQCQFADVRDAEITLLAPPELLRQFPEPGAQKWHVRFEPTNEAFDLMFAALIADIPRNFIDPNPSECSVRVCLCVDFVVCVFGF